ncbi:LacI family DNA-binding transcriptional regulator [Isoptericola variabilis]|uniref:Transcriptional regulator, LacI family n=2 Tax=Isoptericola TaxID=254250 RepID=F6FR48_ISOV2|nr:LacI family DNA-binding transcriptional regulator [Isoptericola variabilis]AEG44998.1 transcriptional regulator, LacI family [Isoptericola variabilis 225]
MSSTERGGGVVTLKDVAAAAGVSVATASQALAGRGRMTAATRARVQRTADGLGYVANPLGRGLRTGRTQALGVHHQSAAASLETPYFREFLAGAIEAAHRHDYDLVVLSSDTARPRRSAPRVDGVVVVDPIGNDLRARALMELPLPVVAGEHVPPDMPPCAVVAADHATAVRTVLDEAAAHGARHVLLAAPDTHSGWGNLLRDVVSAWCAERGTVPVLVATEFGERSVERHRALVEPALGAHPEVELVLVASPFAARGAMDALRALGRQPGRDVLVAAGADAPSLLEEDPPVTAIELPAHALGVACVERLVSILDGDVTLTEALGSVQTVPSPVHLRASTAGELITAPAD